MLLADKILILRGHKVLLDKDLAASYGVETRNVNKAVRRIMERFPEKNFAKDCEDSEDVEFFIKLPRKFAIKTPIGEYRPDWGIVFKGEKKLYFVAETKSGTTQADMRSKEWQKIKCGEAHFAEFPEVKFKHVKVLKDLM